jgi:hypothetical protein
MSCAWFKVIVIFFSVLFVLSILLWADQNQIPPDSGLDMGFLPLRNYGKLWMP